MYMYIHTLYMYMPIVTRTNIAFKHVVTHMQNEQKVKMAE